MKKVSYKDLDLYVVLLDYLLNPDKRNNKKFRKLRRRLEVNILP